MPDDVLLVRVPDGRVEERRYVLDVVLGEWLGLGYQLEVGDDPEVRIQMSGDHSGRGVTLPDILFSTPAGDWLTERSMPVLPLPRLPMGRGSGMGDPLGPGAGGASSSVPVIFGAPGPDGLPWRPAAYGAALAIDVFGSVFFLLTRYEEAVRQQRDAFGRFPADASIAAAEGFLDRPLADEYVDLLCEAMRSVWPGLGRRSSSFRVRLTHDIDEVWAAHGRPGRTIARGLAADLVRRHDLQLAAGRARSILPGPFGGIGTDPFNTFDFLMDISERHGLRSTFYFVAGSTSPGLDGVYRLSDPAVVQLLHRINERGHEIGLHGSYGSHLSAERLSAELEALRVACRAAGFDQPAWGVRQHFLRLSNPETWRSQAAAGLEHDSTLGYPERVGFRAGTCREFPLFDLLAGGVLALRERPLLVMDRTLDDYMALGPDDAVAEVRRVVAMARHHRGDAVLLFHNNHAFVRRRSGYAALIEELLRPVLGA